MLEEVVKDGVVALVRAMATDTWPVARKGIERLFRKKGQDGQNAMAKRLDDDAARVCGSGADESARVRGNLVPQWQVRIQDLVDQHPDIADELRVLEREIRARLPREQPGWTQHNVARDGGQVFGAQGGNVIVNQLPPGPAAPNRTRPSGPGEGVDG